MKSLTITIQLLILVAIIGLGFLFYSFCAGPLLERVDEQPPSIEVAPYKVITMTKILYAEQARANADGSVKLTNWWEPDGQKWLRHGGSIILPPFLQPQLSRR